MRTVATLSPQFWIGETGKAMRPPAGASTTERERFKDARIVAVYLTNAPSSVMYGLYYLTVRTIAEETGLTEAEVRAALALLDGLDYARYDERSQFVWVIQMAVHQLGGPLKPGDRRVANVNGWYRTLPKNPWLGPFYDRYLDDLHLEDRREGVTLSVATPLLRYDDGTGSPFDGAKDLRPLQDTNTGEGVQGKPKAELDAGKLTGWFNEFLAAYPAHRRVGGKKGTLAYQEALRHASGGGPREPAVQRLRRALEAHKRSEQWQTPKLVPSMSKWLSEAHWQRELEAAERPAAPPPVPAESVLGQLLERMEGKVNRNLFQKWFRPLRAGPENGKTITVYAPNGSFEGWISKHYGHLLLEASAEIGRPDLQVKFTVQG